MSRTEKLLVDAFVRTFFVRDRRGGPWTPPAHLPHECVRLDSFGGARLEALWFPADTPRGTVLLAHPDRRYGKHWFVREGWIDLLHENAYDVLAFDFPGYGETGGAPTFYPDHAVHAARHARAWSGGLPVHAVGVSLGAFALAAAAHRLEGVESLVLESPYPSFGAWYGRGPGKWAMDAFGALFPGARERIEVGETMQRTEAKRILVALAPEDEITPAALSEEVARLAPIERTRVVRVEGAKHLGLFRSEAYREAILETLSPALEEAPPKATRTRPMASPPPAPG